MIFPFGFLVVEWARTARRALKQKLVGRACGPAVLKFMRLYQKPQFIKGHSKYNA